MRDEKCKPIIVDETTYYWYNNKKPEHLPAFSSHPHLMYVSVHALTVSTLHGYSTCAYPDMADSTAQLPRTCSSLCPRMQLRHAVYRPISSAHRHAFTVASSQPAPRSFFPLLAHHLFLLFFSSSHTYSRGALFDTFASRLRIHIYESLRSGTSVESLTDHRLPGSSIGRRRHGLRTRSSLTLLGIPSP
jgi:hypothetical protein